MKKLSVREPIPKDGWKELKKIARISRLLTMHAQIPARHNSK